MRPVRAAVAKIQISPVFQNRSVIFLYTLAVKAGNVLLPLKGLDARETGNKIIISCGTHVIQRIPDVGELISFW